MKQSHEQTKEQQNRDAGAARERIIADFRAVFTSDAGRAVLEHLKQSTGHGRPAFLPSAGGGPLDPYAAAFRDGRKSVIDEICATLAIPEDDRGTDPRGVK